MPEQETHVLEPWDALKAHLERGDPQELERFLRDISPREVARALTRLDQDERHRLFELLDPEEAADLIERLSDSYAAEIIEDMPTLPAAAIFDEMESDHRADLLGEMDEEDAEAILRQMDKDEAADARKLLEFEEGTAGSVMVTEFVIYPQDMLVADVIKDMRENADWYYDTGIHYAYVKAPSGRLVGVVRMRDLVLSGAHRRLAEIMVVNPIYVLASAPLEEVDEVFQRYPFTSLPVTVESGVIVGVIRRADLEQALAEEQERNLLRFGGIIGGEEFRDMPLFERTGRRLVWLGFNVVLSILAASVILFFETTINKVFALVFFIPIIGNMCGCSGNQAVAVSIRELAMGFIDTADFLYVWKNELTVGAINGLIIGTVLGLLAVVLNAILWQSSPWLGLVIGTAFAANTMVSVSLGGLIPLLLKKLGMDAALGAPPMLTTLSDMCGLFILFSFMWIAVTALGIG